jgi:hypothetical protein
VTELYVESSSDVRVEVKADGDGTGSETSEEEVAYEFKRVRVCRFRDSRQGEFGRAGVIVK